MPGVAHCKNAAREASMMKKAEKVNNELDITSFTSTLSDDLLAEIYGYLRLNDLINLRCTTHFFCSERILIDKITKGIELKYTIRKIAAGYYNSFALTKNGSVFAWGYNECGQLGVGNTYNENTPNLIAELKGFSQITAANYSTLALTVDGAIYA